MSTRIYAYERIEEEVVAWDRSTVPSATGQTIARLPTHASLEARVLLDQMIHCANTVTSADAADARTPADAEKVYATDVWSALLDAIDDGYLSPQAMYIVLAELDIS